MKAQVVLHGLDPAYLSAYSLVAQVFGYLVVYRALSQSHNFDVRGSRFPDLAFRERCLPGFHA